ncbi:hypothetical protein [Streptomyces sp. NPDC002790]|uniref:hypothetical protein n=1 Tax=Streptomyces sp. NPDC002790 TaxID=3154431 RepID=UPI00331EF7CF
MALPAPVVARPVRATAGRRALQLALLFGGLLVLGIVCGGRAQADGLSSDAGSLGAGHVAVREHVADSVQKLRGAGPRENPALSEATGSTEASDAPGPSTAASTATSAPERAKARPAAQAPAPVRPAAQASAPVRPAEPTPNPAAPEHAPGVQTSPDAKSSPEAKPASGVKRLARHLHDGPAAPSDPTAPATNVAKTTATAATATVRTYLTGPLRQQVEALGGDQVRLRSVADALRYLTAPVGATVRQVAGPVEELATRVVADLVGAWDRPGPPAATTPQQSDTPAAHGDRSGTAEYAEYAEYADRTHAAASAPQAYDVARFGDVQKAEAGARAEARPASPVVPQRPDGVPSAGASAGDGGSSRHGDLHAAAFGDRAPVLLASGATASAGTAPVVDRLRDIPEFPG